MQEYTVDEIILGMASQVSEADDIIVVEDLRGKTFSKKAVKAKIPNRSSPRTLSIQQNHEFCGEVKA